jgi:hypothetical protein
MDVASHPQPLAPMLTVPALRALRAEAESLIGETLRELMAAAGIIINGLDVTRVVTASITADPRQIATAVHIASEPASDKAPEAAIRNALRHAAQQKILAVLTELSRVTDLDLVAVRAIIAYPPRRTRLYRTGCEVVGVRIDLAV